VKPTSTTARSNATALFLSRPVAANNASTWEIATVAKTSTGAVTSLVTGRGAIWQLLVTPTLIVWLEAGTTGYQLFAAPITGGAGAQIRLLGSLPDRATNLAFDGTYLYWTVHAVGTGAVERLELGAANSEAEDVAFDLSYPLYAVVDDTYVYYLADAAFTPDANLYRARKNGSAIPERIALRTGMTWLTQVDDKYVWGVEGANLYRTPK
jgi:hypothetical protein